MKATRIIVLAGPPCSGKSQLAGLLAQELGIVHLAMDDFRKRLMPDSDHREEHRQIAYRAMHMAAGLLLERGFDVIIDATYIRTVHREELGQVALRAGSSIFLIECHVVPEEAAARFRSRGKGHAGIDLTEEIVSKLASNYPYCRKGLALETGADSATCVRRIDEYVDSGRPLRPGDWS